MRKLILIILLLIPITIISQITSNGNGNWLNSNTWVGGTIPIENDNVVIDNNDEIIISFGDSIKISEIWLGNNSIITIEGILVIDSLHINNRSTLNVSGKVYVLGGATLANNTELTINNTGNVYIEGDVDTGNGSELIVDGELNIGGDLTGDATLSGDGVINVDGDVDDSINDTNDVLPIELLYFNVYYLNNLINLSWSTSIEINNDYFILEYSIDGLLWELICYVKGAGNSNQINNYKYSYFTTNNYYYKLTQVDYNGESESFEMKYVISKNINRKTKYIVYDIDGKFIVSGYYDEIINYLEVKNMYFLKNEFETIKLIKY